MNIIEMKDKYNAKDSTLYGKQNIVDSTAMLYHENSKFTTHSIRISGEKIEEFYNPYFVERSSQPFKCYPNHKRIDLSVYIKNKPEINFFDVLTNRRSIRNYNNEYKLSLNELAILLNYSYGVTHENKIDSFGIEGHIGMRNVPSGGALYPLELYVIIFNAHIPSGLYHYRPDINCLEILKNGNFADELLEIIQAEPYVNMRASSALIITTGIIERVYIKYGDRGYRFLMQESGFVGQTISLLAESISLGSCMLGGYIDDKVNSFLGVDGVFETINNIVVIGKKGNNTNAQSCKL